MRDGEKFIRALDRKALSLTASAALRALWLDYHGKWDEAHEAIQDESSGIEAAIHAYLHRKEGDIWNANYWYRAAGRNPFKGTLAEEWSALVQETQESMGVTATQTSSQRG